MTRAELETNCTKPIAGSTLLLASGLAHELSNALNGIGLNADLARLVLQRGETQTAQRLIDQVLGDFQRSVALLNGLRSFASMPNALHVAPASAGELLEEARGLALQEPWRRQARIVVDQAPPELGIACDRESVIRALLQLVRNAAEAGATTIRLAGDAPADGQVRLRVRDDGPGIAPERMQRLFQMFSSGNRQAGRLGLGLWTVQRICAAQGGQAQARNLSPTGAEFALLLPRAADGE